MISKEKVKKIIKKCLMDKFDGKIHVYDFPELNIALQDAVDEYEVWTDAEEPPSDDRYVLLSFANMTDPMIGRYEKYKDGSGCYFIGDDERSCLKGGFIVNGWMELPKRKEE